jgi:hypothetical protein
MTYTAVIVMEMRDGEDIQSLVDKVELAVHRMDLDQTNTVVTPRYVACREVEGGGSVEDFARRLAEPMSTTMLKLPHEGKGCYRNELFPFYADASQELPDLVAIMPEQYEGPVPLSTELINFLIHHPEIVICACVLAHPDEDLKALKSELIRTGYAIPSDGFIFSEDGIALHTAIREWSIRWGIYTEDLTYRAWNSERLCLLDSLDRGMRSFYKAMDRPAEYDLWLSNITTPIIEDERGLFRDGHYESSFYVNREFIDELRTICGRMPAPEIFDTDVHPGGIFG